MDELYNIIFTLIKCFHYFHISIKPQQVILGIYMYNFTSQTTQQFLIFGLKLKSQMDQLTELLLCVSAAVLVFLLCNSLTQKN